MCVHFLPLTNVFLKCVNKDIIKLCSVSGFRSWLGMMVS